MMCDTNWCTFCDNAISPYSDSLYCSEDCLRQDALMHHPMLGYDYAELQDFPVIQKRRKSSSIMISSSHKQQMISSLLSSSLSSILSSSDTNHQQPATNKARKTPLALCIDQQEIFHPSS